MSSEQGAVAISRETSTEAEREIEIEDVEGEDYGVEGGLDEIQNGYENDEDKRCGQILCEMWPHSRWTLLGMVVWSRLVFPGIKIYGNHT